jgi:hypothetical protein
VAGPNPLTDAQAASYTAQGFEVSIHVDTNTFDNCTDYTPASLESDYANQLAEWAAQFPSVPAPRTERTHCVVWSDYDTQPQVQLNHGIRLDTNYYYWPPTWVNDQPGFFTGSGMPMRFTKADGTMIDVYQAPTQMTDESNQSYPFTINTLLDNAIGPTGYYGVFTANMHSDQLASAGANAIVASALARGIPVVSALQLLQWLEGRNNSAFSGITWDGTTLSFTLTMAESARNLQGMIPVPAGLRVISITANGTAVPFSIAQVKGVQYAFIMASAAPYQVVFGR